MNLQEILEKFAIHEKRIHELEQQSRNFQAEKHDHTFREDMKKDGKIDNQPISREMAIQTINSFYAEYDKVARQNIEDLRHRDPTNKEIAEYDAKLARVQHLKKEFGL